MLLFKVRKVMSPWCGVFIGYRMALAVPNTSGFNGQPLFGGKFLMAESSDMSTYPTQDQMVAWILDNCQGEQVSIYVAQPVLQGEADEE